MKLQELVERIKVKKDKEEKVKAKYKELNKVKKLTQEQRITRIEELLGIGKGGDVDG